MLLKCLVLLCSVISCFSKRQYGEVCIIPIDGFNITGTCQPITKCGYAMMLVDRDEKKPTHCWWEDDLRIVCCPRDDIKFRTGFYGRLYDPQSDGIKRSGTTICRYDGDRHQCCPIVAERPLPDETAAGCPPLPKLTPPPRLNAVQLIAWNKCVENQRFVKQCIAKPEDKDRLIRKKVCGIADEVLRISGGREARATEFPHMAVLGVAEPSDSDAQFDVEWVGGGALISDRFILTAAHVLIDPRSRPLRFALLGALRKRDVLNGLLHNIVRKIPHHLYDSKHKNNDIALVELDRRVTLSSFVRPICLPLPGQRLKEQYLRDIAGWGRTGPEARASPELRATQITALEDYSECDNRLGTSDFHYNSSTMICGMGQLKRDTCPGDSGGPLMAQLNDTDVPCSYTVEGVVSFGPNCGMDSASVYTRVQPYLDWIVRNVWPDDWQRATAPNYN